MFTFSIPYSIVCVFVFYYYMIACHLCAYKELFTEYKLNMLDSEITLYVMLCKLNFFFTFLRYKINRKERQEQNCLALSRG